jgi:hypothetical protein
VCMAATPEQKKPGTQRGHTQLNHKQVSYEQNR